MDSPENCTHRVYISHVHDAALPEMSLDIKSPMQHLASSFPYLLSLLSNLSKTPLCRNDKY